MTQPAPPTCYRHPDRPTYVRCVRCDRPICPDCMRAASVGFQCPEEASAPAVRTYAPAGSAGELMQRAPVTATLIALNVVVFIALVADGSGFLSSSGSLLHSELAQRSVASAAAGSHGSVVVVPGIAEGRWWQLFTAMFVHYGLIHLGSNMLVLLFLGLPFELRVGRTRMLATYLVAGLGGGVATFLFSTTGESAGASGAIFGLLGAYAVLARRGRWAELGSITGTIVLNLVFTFTIPGISLTDHVGGLVTGAVLGLLLGTGGQLPVRSRARSIAVLRIATGFAAVVVVLVAVTVVRTHVLRDRYGVVHQFTESASAAPGPRPAARAAAPPPSVG